MCLDLEAHLRSVTKKSAAVGRAAAAHGLLVAETIKVVVKSQLGACDREKTKTD